MHKVLNDHNKAQVALARKMEADRKAGKNKEQTTKPQWSPFNNLLLSIKKTEDKTDKEKEQNFYERWYKKFKEKKW